MKLNSQQIDQLYAFTRQHYVEWYDLQTELVDHLANDIESIWEENPKLTFNQVRNQSFKKFGIFGFNDVVEKKRKSLNKKYWILVWKYFKEFFTLPKVILTFLLIGITYALFNLVINKDTLVAIYFGLFFLTIFSFMYYNQKRTKASIKQTGKKWLFQDNIKNMGGVLSLMGTIPNLYNFLIDEPKWSQINVLITSIFFVLFSLLIYILINLIPARLEEEMIQQYHEYKLLSKG